MTRLLLIFKIQIKNTQKQMPENIFRFICFFAILVVAFSAVAPFIPLNHIHQAKSEFQFNLILNQNRNIPIIFMQYSEDKTLNILKPLIQNAYTREPDISFTVLVDCRQFSFDLNNSLGLCRGYEAYLKEVEDGKHQKPSSFEDDQTKITEMFLKFDFFSPNPTRIMEKGHKLIKNHDIQNLRQLGVNVDSAFLAKIIRNQIPDLVTYVEDQIDLETYLQTKSSFKLSKMPKILYFDQNLQAPLFLKKLAVNLDGWIQVAVTDSNTIGNRFKTHFQEILLFQYDFQANKYQVRKIAFDEDDNPLQAILKAREIKEYTSLRKPRDILIDFQHKNSVLYNITHVKQIHQLLAHGRIVLLEVSAAENAFQCQQLTHLIKQHDDLLFNYICFAQQDLSKLLTITQTDPSKHWLQHIYMIESSLKKPKLLKKTIADLYSEIPKSLPRQTISSEKQAELCLSAAKSTQRKPIFFYFNEKTHSRALNLLKYFNSLPEVTAFLYFCQFYLPDAQVVRKYQLRENTVFVLGNEDKYGQAQKIEHSNLLQFDTTKMFLRQFALSKMMEAYDDKMLRNDISEITSAEELTRECFSEKCLIALIETNTFHQETEIKILKEMKIAFSSESYKYFWIDGLCHFQVGKQLKLNEKAQKFINKSYLFLYQEKTNSYALFKGSKLNKFWEKKSVFRWIKSLKTEGVIGRIKFGIDLQEKGCVRQQKKRQKQGLKEQRKDIAEGGGKGAQRRKSQQVDSDEL